MGILVVGRAGRQYRQATARLWDTAAGEIPPGTDDADINSSSSRNGSMHRLGWRP
jgi:phage gp36-like protein